MVPKTQLSSQHLMEGLALTALSGLVYYASFILQVKISPLVNFTQGIDLFFIPAGVKLIAFMVAGVWGFWGIALCGLFTAFDVWQQDSWLVHIGNIAVWAGLPFATYKVVSKALGIDKELRSIRYWHVVVITLSTTLTSSFGSNIYQYLINNRSADMITGSSMAMAMGDFVGAGVCALVVTFVVKRLFH